MRQLNGFAMWVFLGDESNQRSFRGKAVDDTRYYVGNTPGGELAAGPFGDEARALSAARAMTNTSGT